MYRVLASLLLFATVLTDSDRLIFAEAPQASPTGAYWCPMHPNVRGNSGDRCRICRMPLVLAPPPDYAPYHLSVETNPHAPKAGQRTRIHLLIGDPHRDQPVTNFETVHEQLLHLFILSQDLAYFAHVHPSQQTNGSFVYEGVFPNAGAYRLIADFLPAGGSPQLLQQTVVTSGYTGSLIPRARLAEDVSDKIAGDVRVKLSMPPAIGGREQLLTFQVFDSVSGAPLFDLQSYLGAVGHLLLVSADLESVAHSHPVADMSANVGPTIVFQAMFPRAGMYRLWVQFQRRDRVLVAPFNVSVRAREPVGR